MRRRPLLLTVLPPGTIPSVFSPRCPRRSRKGARAALSVAAARGGRARACRRGHPKPKVRAPTPSGLWPRGHGSSHLFLSLALYCSSLELLSSIHAIPSLLLPRTRESRCIFVSRLNQFGKQVLQVVLPRARSEKHATLWLLFSTVPSSEFWCFLPSKKSPALSFCPV
jgi:hypothetical protein